MRQVFKWAALVLSNHRRDVEDPSVPLPGVPPEPESTQSIAERGWRRCGGKPVVHVYRGRHEDVLVHRLVFSEKDRIGIGTFAPSDPKSQDITELTGSIDLSTIGEVGVESDPRAPPVPRRPCRRPSLTTTGCRVARVVSFPESS